MSALPPKADIRCDSRNVRFGPITDMDKRGWNGREPARLFLTATFFCRALRLPNLSDAALGDYVDDLERHHHFADLIDDLDERGNRAAIGL
jgi:hypothetical protein